MSASLCSVCGAVLRDGACPNGHPQRSSRRRDRRSRRGLWSVLIILLILAGAAYGGLVLYPRTAASNLMGPTSEEFSSSLVAYRSTAGAFPPGATDPQALGDIAAAILGSAQEASTRLADASLALEEQEAVDLPVVSSRPPLADAIALRDRVAAFYASAREVVASLEAIAGYVTQVSGTLDEVQSLENNLNAAKAVDPRPAVTSSIPVADQLIADLQAITPPDELGALHASLVGIAERIRTGLDDVTAAAGGGRQTQPVVAATLQGLRDEIATFKETLGSTPRLARRVGLAPRLQEVDALAVEITEELSALRDQGVEDITLPGEE
jgi:hypothetical protein